MRARRAQGGGVGGAGGAASAHNHGHGEVNLQVGAILCETLYDPGEGAEKKRKNSFRVYINKPWRETVRSVHQTVGYN